MVLQAKALVTGLALASGLLFAASSKGKGSGGSSGASSAGNTTPSGADPGRLADLTTQNLLRQDIAGLRTNIQAWTDAGDPLTAGALQFTLDASVGGQQLVEWTNDGNAGSPMLRAFGDRVLLLEGRPEKLNLWADAWDPTLPLLAAGLRAKAQGINPSSHAGTTDDPVPSSDLLQRIGEVVASGDSSAMRELADELDKAGFPEQAADLRAAADMLDKGQAKTVPTPANPSGGAVAPAPAPAPAPSGGTVPASNTGRTYTVRSGDNPSKIAQALTGNANRWTELVAANVPPKKKAANGNFATLNAGEILKIPASWPNATGLIAPAPSPSSATTPATPAAVGATYTVKSGDNPSKIAQALTGNANRWTELVAANVPPKKRAANGNFATLNPGEVLKLPASWSASTSPQSSASSPLPVSPSAPVAPAQKNGRTYTVKSGDSPSKIAKTLTGFENKWPELVAANVPPKKKAANGNFTTLNPGEVLKIPDSWVLVSGDDLEMSGETYRHLMYGGQNQMGTLPHRRVEMGADAPLDARQVSAGRIALNAHYGRLDPDLLAEWQKREGIKSDPSGKYGPESAYVLCFRYGIVPPVPHFMPPGGVQKFVGQMMAAARKDGVRADEYKAVANKAVSLTQKGR